MTRQISVLQTNKVSVRVPKILNCQFYLPDSGQISQVEDVVELGWRGQHLDLDLLPQDTSGDHQGFHQLHNLVSKATLLK